MPKESITLIPTPVSVVGQPQNQTIMFHGQTVTKGEAERYARTAEGLGASGLATALNSVLNAESSLDRFRTFLAENGCPVYDDKQVAEYLFQHRPWFRRPVWVPVNAGSKGVQYGYLIRYNGARIRTANDMSLYARPIPEPVLIKMQTLKKYDYSIQFFVSDFARGEDVQRLMDRDPFLAVQQSTNWAVIERWDEPTFRMK
jgi:hypothetical protein